MPSVQAEPTAESVRNYAEVKQILLIHKQAIDALNEKLNNYQHYHLLTHDNIGNLHERFRVTLRELHKLSLANDKNTMAYQLQITEVMEQMANCEAKLNSMITTQEKIIEEIEKLKKEDE